MSAEDEFRYRNKGTVKKRIADQRDSMTEVEKSIVEYFLNNEELVDFSSKAISKNLYVSEAALSRFSKKCGYKSYKEFVFAYENDVREQLELEKLDSDVSIYSKSVGAMYTQILKNSFEVLDEKRMERIANALLNCKEDVFVYGMGSSGFAAEELTYRFMRLGLNIQTFTDSHMMRMSAALAKKNTIVIAITISGTTREIAYSLRIAKKNGARIFLFTANVDSEIASVCDELVELSYIKDLDNGTKISPQISPLIMIDILYAYYLSINTEAHLEKYNETLSAIKDIG